MDFEKVLLEHHAHLGDKLVELKAKLEEWKEDQTNVPLFLKHDIVACGAQIELLDDLCWHYRNGKDWTWRPICVLEKTEESELN